MAVVVRGKTVQDWLAAHRPALARECDAIPGLAKVFADIVEGIVDHCEEQPQLVLEQFRPIARVQPDGKIIIDLNPPRL